MKKIVVTLGDSAAVEVEIPAGKGALWIYRDRFDKVFASRTAPKDIGPGHFVIRHFPDGPPAAKPKSKLVSYGNVKWEGGAA